MLVSSTFRNSLLDDFFGLLFDRYSIDSLVNTDTKGVDNGYEVTINIPGVKKEDVKAELRDGYPTIQAFTDSNKERKGSNGGYIRRERYSGSCNRSFYVGDAVTQEDTGTEFEDDTLKLLIPKKEAVPEMGKRKHIAIER